MNTWIFISKLNSPSVVNCPSRMRFKGPEGRTDALVGSENTAPSFIKKFAPPGKPKAGANGLAGEVAAVPTSEAPASNELLTPIVSHESSSTVGKTA